MALLPAQSRASFSLLVLALPLAEISTLSLLSAGDVTRIPEAVLKGVSELFARTIRAPLTHSLTQFAVAEMVSCSLLWDQCYFYRGILRYKVIQLYSPFLTE